MLGVEAVLADGRIVQFGGPAEDSVGLDVVGALVGSEGTLAIITEATLSFLGVGLPSTQPSLGTLIRLGNELLQSGEWWITVFPGVTLAALVLAVNLLGDWLRDALNPKLR